MLLTITTNHRPATDLGYLLHKNPVRCQSFALSFGKAHVFYTEATEDRCTAALLLEVDPVAMVRGKGGISQTVLAQYVNDRPYVASSFMSVAIAQVLGSGTGWSFKRTSRIGQHPNSASGKLLKYCPAEAARSFLNDIFQPLGYEIQAIRYPLDEKFEDWGPSPYYSVTLSKTTTLSELLTHLYVLIPVFDNFKHYYVGQEELEKLLKHGEGWLASHPKREAISRRYLKHRYSLAREAIARLAEQDDQPAEELVEARTESKEELLEKPISLNERRLDEVVAQLKKSDAKRVLDLGCGEGRLLRELLKEKQFEEIVGMDVAVRSLEIASERLHLDDLPPKQKDRIRLLHGSLMYRDKRLAGFDAAAVVEVIEHLDPPRLAAFERVVFEFARPATIVLTTPNREYNVTFDNLAAGAFRHEDHRFEWSREEFQTWAKNIADRFGYTVQFQSVGLEHPEFGPPTQMGVFKHE